MKPTNRLTTTAGVPVVDNQNAVTAGPRGPMLLQDAWLLEKLAHFDREVIPERRKHAKGSAAYGRFIKFPDLNHAVKRDPRTNLLSIKGHAHPLIAKTIRAFLTWRPSMKPVDLKMKCALALVIGGILAAGPAIADKPSWAGAGKGGKNERMDRRDRDEPSAGKGGHFEDQHRVMVREYYTEQFRGGRRCPPGLAKKHNGCMPPGQAKKWQVGRPLPRDVIYYEVPQPLVLQIGAPPSGHRYVRVASDILMIAIGTGMVVDAIRDLGR